MIRAIVKWVEKIGDGNRMMARRLRRDDDDIKNFVEIEARGKKADDKIGIRTCKLAVCSQ